MDSLKFRMELVRFFERFGIIKDERIKNAFLEIPREIFTPCSSSLQSIYSDEVIITYLKNGEVVSTSSQPSLMAKMLELAGVKEGGRVLEIGTGTGYNAAIISKIVGENGKVVTLEINKEICKIAKNNFKKLKLENIIVLNSDGDPDILKEFAPFDSVIATVGIDFPRKDFSLLVDQYGRICFPLNFHTTDQNPTCVMTKISNHFLFDIKIASRFLRAHGNLAWRNGVVEKVDIRELKTSKPIDEFELREFSYRRFIDFLELLTLSLYEKSGDFIYIDEEENLALITGKRIRIYSGTTLREKIEKSSLLWNELGKPSIFDLSYKIIYDHEFPRIEPTIY